MAEVRDAAGRRYVVGVDGSEGSRAALRWAAAEAARHGAELEVVQMPLHLIGAVRGRRQWGGRGPGCGRAHCVRPGPLVAAAGSAGAARRPAGTAAPGRASTSRRCGRRVV